MKAIPGPADLRIVGSSSGATTVPLAHIVVSRGVATYETLYTTLDASGNPQQTVYGGSWGTLFRAGRR